MSVKSRLLLPVVLLMFAGTSVRAGDFPPAPGKRYDVGGYSIHMLCKGQGEPTVIIDAGLGDDSSDWFDIQNHTSVETRVCVFDRPGYGWSDAGPQPRNSLRISDEMGKLIQKAGIPGPYILVGHSFGGYNIRVFAAHHPQQVAGMVLVDASHENQYERLNINLPKHFDRKGNILILPKSNGTISDKATALRERAFHAARAEISSLHQSAFQVRQLDSLPKIPLIVISRGQSEWTLQRKGKNREKIWQQLQQELWKLSPLSQQIFANRSGHDIHIEQPELVVGAINDVLNMSRVMQ